MAIITKIENQKKNKDRVNIYLDYEYAVSMNYDLLLSKNLKVGQDIGEEELKQIVIDNEKSYALTMASKLLGKNLKTVKQMQDYLKMKGFDYVVIDYVVNKLCEYNYLNDDNYADIYIRSVQHKYGKLKIKTELIKKGISKELVEEKLSNFECDDEILMELAKKFFKNKDVNQENITKLIRNLMSKGFSYDDIKEIVRKLKELEC